MSKAEIRALGRVPLWDQDVTSITKRLQSELMMLSLENAAIMEEKTVMEEAKERLEKKWE